ncbi:AzlD domain-containing protein [Virgibacillus necropolis]|uniref:Branched-chain amino acid transport n=1 Tax=Virgibacillus necropolis TaxID=163877 RepID=A0A221MCR5_9BACI|nr:AzlD domain-containing protein [Virgibacillus necropolis]ASN05445.1 branched-chain amino acid transport [Virgibacillus necropolis]
MINNWILIGLLSVSTYLSRVIGVEFMSGREMNPTLRMYFNYVPIAIISALIVNQILTPADGEIVISFPILIGCLATAITIKIINMFLPSVVIGIAIGILTRYFL